MTGGQPSRPLVLVTACVRKVDATTGHAVYEQYIDAIQDPLGADPVILPAVGADGFRSLLPAVDGVMLTGSLSNVAPDRYGGPPARAGTQADPARDSTTLPLVHACLAQGLPLLAICRGFQELNVALGGSLHQHLAEVPGRIDHEAATDRPRATRYGFRHVVHFAADSLIGARYGAPEAAVNSLHGQGVDRLAPGLTVEALAPDGTVEAFRVSDSPGFALGVQWHPEWQAATNPLSRAVFGLFGEACQRRRAERLGLPRDGGGPTGRSEEERVWAIS
ncbi:MAG: gamma-glutamyl-gamma-aminobutyrate hydrolase family protein [Sneathiellaceae bacterium]